MYNKINITENTLQVLSLFTDGFDRDHHIREVERLLSISPRTAQLILEDLERKGVMESRTKGRTKLYSLKLNESTKRYIILVEQYKSISFLEKNLVIKEAIERALPSIKGIGIIFGSHAKDTATKGSDVDLFVAGTYDKEEIEKISTTFGLEINVKCYPLRIFEKSVHRDFLLKEILKNHIVFLNAERFIQAVLNHG